MLGPVYAGTAVPFLRPLVVLGEGMGSYCRVKSQYCVYEPLQKSGQLRKCKYF